MLTKTDKKMIRKLIAGTLEYIALFIFIGFVWFVNAVFLSRIVSTLLIVGCYMGIGLHKEVFFFYKQFFDYFSKRRKNGL